MMLQERMDAAIDEVLDVLDQAQQDGVELDPLATIMARVKARGDMFDLAELPPFMQMLLGGLAE